MCPDAKLVLPVDAPRSEWLTERRKGLGGSDASTIAGLNDYNSLYALWLDKTGRGTEKPQTQRMRMGKLLEPVMTQIFTEDTGLAIQPRGLMRSLRHPWMQVTVDGLVEDGGLIEFKTTNWRTDDAKIWGAGDVPDHAEAQSQWGMAVTGRSHCYAMVLIDGADFHWQRIDRNPALSDVLTDLGDQFWTHRVLADSPPPVDSSQATLDALHQLYAQSDGTVAPAGADILDVYLQWRLHKANAKAEEDAAKALEPRLVDAFGPAELLTVEGDEVATRKQNGTFSSKAFTALYPDLAAEYATTVPALDMPRIKIERPAEYTAARARVLRAVKK
jgi:putative phage-type endonuclease